LRIVDRIAVTRYFSALSYFYTYQLFLGPNFLLKTEGVFAYEVFFFPFYKVFFFELKRSYCFIDLLPIKW